MAIKTDKRAGSQVSLLKQSDAAKVEKAIARATPQAAPKNDALLESASRLANKLAGTSASIRHVPTRPDALKGYVVVTSNDDDPFARPATTERIDRSDFTLDANGKPTGLVGPRVVLFKEDALYRRNAQGQFAKFATNPFDLPTPNRSGNFTFPNESRFPLHTIKRDATGKAVLDENGLQQWDPRTQHVGQTTVFESVNQVGKTTEGWSGRPILWGENGQLPVSAQATVEFNAFYMPGARALFFGVVPYRLPGETDIKLFETASSWEIAAHEAGHAAHRELKPNIANNDTGFRQWGESFGDQMAMWTSLQDPDRVKTLLRETRGDLNKSNALTQMGEVFAGLVGEGTGLRDNFHNKTVATTTDEVHDRGEVLTGASYKIFQRVLQEEMKAGKPQAQAVVDAANIMGTFLTRAADFVPENSVAFEDVAKAYLSVDQEYFGGKYQAILAPEFERRGMLRPAVPATPTTPAVPGSVDEWKAHRASVPALNIGTAPDRAAVEKFVADNTAAFGIPDGYTLGIQSHTTLTDGRQVVRVQLKDPAGQVLENHGILTFRQDGSLADAHSAFPKGLTPDEAKGLLAEAAAAGLAEKGKLGFRQVEVPPEKEGEPSTFKWSVVVTQEFPKQEGASTADKLNAHMMVYSLEHPEGVRVEYAEAEPDHDLLMRNLPKGAQLLTGAEA